MKTILLAIDFSDGIESCCNYATHIAAKFEAEIILFHSYFDKFLLTESNYPTGIETDTLINQKIIEDIKTQAEKELSEVRECIVQAYPKLKITQTLSGGNPDEEIINAAESFKVDLIILGSSGKAAKGIFSGSISKKIIEKISVPVLSIPLNYEYNPFKHVLYPTEFLHDDIEIIETIFGLLSKLKIKIHCLHLAQTEEPETKASIEKIQSKFKKEIESGLLTITMLISESFTQSLQSFIAKNEINLIAFVAHKRGFLKEIFTHKLTKKDLFQLHLPMLALKK